MVTFHILDVSARDEKVVSENETEKLVQYAPGDDSDDEFKPTKKSQFNFMAGQRMVVHLFGKTAAGNTIRCDVKGFKPFFYIQSIEGNSSVKEGSRVAVREYIKRHLPQGMSSIEITHCNRKELYGYTQDKYIPMLKITMNSINLFHAVKKLFLNGKSEPELKKLGSRFDALGFPYSKMAPKVYEANLDPMLRFLHMRNLKPCGWCSIDGFDEADFGEGSNVLEAEVEDIHPAEGSVATAPFTIASWDIECMSNSGGFPMAVKGDPIIQIGVILGKLGSHEIEKHIFVLDTCDNIPEGEVHWFKKEKDLLVAWFQWMDEKGVDILMGYNIFGFDEKYVWERCEQLGISGRNEIQQMNRLYEVGGEMKMEEKRLSSSAMGDNFLYLWNTPGRLRVDLYHYIKRGYQLGSYKLDDTSRHFLGEAVKGISEKVEGWQLTIGPTKQDVAEGRSVVLLNEGGDTLCDKLSVISVEDGLLVVEQPEDVIPDEVAKWAVVKDDVSPKEMFKLHLGTSADRAIIARYCVQDCQLVLDLFKKLEVFNNSMSMANVSSVPVPYIFLRGQGVKIESLMFKYCYEAEQCIEVLSGGGDGGEKYEGAIVLDPTPGFYTVPVGVADFASLYPSTIISENISHDTLVWVKDYTEDGRLLSVVWGSDQYDGLEGVSYTDIEYDNFIDDPEDERKAKRQLKKGIRVCRYAQNKMGTIPLIVQGLLAARKAKRKEGEKEQDPFRKALLDAEQLAYKLTANSLYGQLGSGTFKIRLKALAASVTAYGRKQIMFAKKVIETQYPDSRTVYGDTDSLFIAFHPKDSSGKPLEGQEALEKTIHLTEEAGKLVTKALKNPHDFEFDKVYWPFIIFSKKRYVGHKYEVAHKYSLAFMGIALKRRDYAAIAKRFYAGALQILLNEKDVPKAAELVRNMAKDLVEGKFGLQPLIISKSLRADYRSVPAHKILADRIAAREPGNAPASGDRIPYVYVQAEVGQKASDLQGERIETPSYIKEKGLKPDYMYYIDHQIANPLCQLFGIVVDKIPGFEGYLPKGGWSDLPDARIVQRETAAYKLLFDDAIQANNKGATRAFASMLGATVTSNLKPTRTVQTRAMTKTTTKQSTLDSLFSARLQIDAVKEVKRKKAKTDS
jgi:DNA polymerase elongation subunit (family B)